MRSIHFGSVVTRLSTIVLVAVPLNVNLAHAGNNDPPIPLRARPGRLLPSIQQRTDRNAAPNFMQQRTFFYRITDELGGGIITMLWPNARIVAAVAGLDVPLGLQRPSNEAQRRRQNGLGDLAVLRNDVIRRILRSGLSTRDLMRAGLVSPELRFLVGESRRADERISQLRDRLRHFDYIRTHFVLEQLIRTRDFLIFYDSQHLGVSFFDQRLTRQGYDPIVGVVTRCAAMGWESAPFVVHNQLVGASENHLFYFIHERGQGTRGLFYACRPELLGQLQDGTVHAERIGASSARMVETPDAVIFLTLGSEPSFLLRKNDLNEGQFVRRPAMLPTNPRHVLFANGYIWVLGPQGPDSVSQLFALDPQRLLLGENAVLRAYTLANVGEMRVVGNYLQLRDEQGGQSRFFLMDPTRPEPFIRYVPGIGEGDTRGVVVAGDFAYFSEATLARVGAVNLRDVENMGANPFLGYVPVQGDLSRPVLSAGGALLVDALEAGRIYIIDTQNLVRGVAGATIHELGVALGEPLSIGNYFFVADLRGERIFVIDGRTHRIVADVHTTLAGVQPTVPIHTSRRNLICAHGMLFLINQVDGTTKIFDLRGLENL